MPGVLRFWRVGAVAFLHARIYKIGRVYVGLALNGKWLVARFCSPLDFKLHAQIGDHLI